MNNITPKTICNSKQNHPELIIKDCIKEFNLNDKEADKLRFIIMNRGVNKWLLARIKFIQLKHKVKEELNKIRIEWEKDRINRDLKWKFNFLNKLNADMQNIAKMPRWVEWGKHIHRKMKKNEEGIIIKGKHC